MKIRCCLAAVETRKQKKHVCTAHATKEHARHAHSAILCTTHGRVATDPERNSRNATDAKPSAIRRAATPSLVACCSAASRDAVSSTAASPLGRRRTRASSCGARRSRERRVASAFSTCNGAALICVDRPCHVDKLFTRLIWVSGSFFAGAGLLAERYEVKSAALLQLHPRAAVAVSKLVTNKSNSILLYNAPVPALPLSPPHLELVGCAGRATLHDPSWEGSRRVLPLARQFSGELPTG